MTAHDVNGYRHLLDPLRLQHGLELRNRAVVTAHGTGLAREGIPTPDLVEYHRARAKGGVGLIITEHNSVHPSSRLMSGTTLEAYSDRIVGPYSLLTDAVHAEGGVIFAQLSHAGMRSGKLPEMGYLVGASAYAPLRSDEHIHELTVAEISELVEAYAAAARRMRDGGFDGVEVHLGHGNILQQFLSPLTNVRTDEYGGEIGRERFAAEVIIAVAEAVPELEMSWRISADELIPGGLVLPDMIRIVRSLLVTTGVTPSILNVSAGQDVDPLSSGLHQGPMYVKHGHLVPLAAEFKREFPQLVVSCIGRITDPELAEEILEAGSSDLVGMTRAHIADPYLISKVARGDRDEVNPCIGCNIACFGRLESGTHISCIGNPASGREVRLRHSASTTQIPRKVVIVGGGPAGLEAAVRAGQEGHYVTLLEAEAEVGGFVKYTRRLPGRAETNKIILYREGLLAKLSNVTIRCGVLATAEMIRALSPDFVVIATGTLRASVEGLVGDWTTEWDVMNEPEFKSDPKHQVVFDDHGDVLGAAVAEHLARRGHNTSLLYRSDRVMPNVDRGTRAIVQERLRAANVKVSTGVSTPPELTVERGVLVGRRTSRDELSTLLTEHKIMYSVVGDAKVPRGLEHAMLEGRLAIDQVLAGIGHRTRGENHG